MLSSVTFLSEKIVQYVDEAYSLSENERELLKFGIESSLEIGINILASIVLLYIINMIPEGLFFFCVFIPIRMYSGGYHADTYIRCFMLSMVSLLGVMILGSKIYIAWETALITITVQIVIIWRIAPVINAERPVSRREYQCFSDKLKKVLVLVEMIAVILVILKRQRFMNTLVLSLLLIIITLVIGRIKYSDCQMEK